MKIHNYRNKNHCVVKNRVAHRERNGATVTNKPVCLNPSNNPCYYGQAKLCQVFSYIRPWRTRTNYTPFGCHTLHSPASFSSVV